MKKAALVLGCISVLTFVTGAISFLIWTQHFQLETTGWDVLLWVALVAFPVAVVCGLLAIGLVFAAWLSLRSQQP